MDRLCYVTCASAAPRLQLSLAREGARSVKRSLDRQARVPACLPACLCPARAVLLLFYVLPPSVGGVIVFIAGLMIPWCGAVNNAIMAETVQPHLRPSQV